MCGCLSRAPTGDLAHNPGMCPDLESTWNRTGDPVVHRLALSLLSHTSRAEWNPFKDDNVETHAKPVGAEPLWRSPSLSNIRLWFTEWDLLSTGLFAGHCAGHQWENGEGKDTGPSLGSAEALEGLGQPRGRGKNSLKNTGPPASCAGFFVVLFYNWDYFMYIVLQRFTVFKNMV